MKQDRKEKGNVPNLRFPGFEGEWETVKIKDFGTIVTGNTPPTNDTENYGNDYLWASPPDLGISKYITYTKTMLSVKGFKKTRKIPQGSILVTCIGIIGKMGMATKDMTTNQQINSIVVDSNFDYDFVYYAINSQISKYLSFVSQQVVPIISKSVFEKLNNHSTFIEEQKKIGRLFSLIDDRISTQNKIIEQYKSLIKGITDHILKGEKANIKLNDCVICNSSSLTESEFEGSKGLYPVYGATGIIAYTSKYDVEEDSILVIKDGASVGRVQYVTGKYSAIGTLNYLTAKKNFSLRYIYYLLRCFNFDKYKVGSGIPHIYFKDYGNELIYCPPIQEQNKIAQALSLIEEKFNTEKDILKAYSLQKEYLLQNLFI